MEMTAALDPPAIPTAVERTFTCADGLELAAQCYSYHPSTTTATTDKDNSASCFRILMLHGWLDNCRSFWTLAPSLFAKLRSTSSDDDNVMVELVVLDLPGHGRSQHKSRDGPTVLLAEGCYYVADVLMQLEWTTKSITLVGHSMGAAIALLYASAFPEQIQHLVLLESWGPMTKPATAVPTTIRRHVEKRLQQSKGSNNSKRTYPSMEAAVAARLHTVKLFPGNQTLSHKAAYELVLRSIEDDNSNDTIAFGHDKRLQWPSLLFLTDDQMQSVYESLQSNRVLVVLGETGYPMDPTRVARVRETLQPTQVITLPGSHHLHADPDTAPAVVNVVYDFITTTPNANE